MRQDDALHPGTDAANEAAEGSGRSFAVSRRTLLKAGWSVPVILTVAPAVAFAASGTSSTTTPSGGKTPRTIQPPSTTNTPTGNSSTPTEGSGPAGGSTGVTEQPSEGPQPARINRGFTG